VVINIKFLRLISGKFYLSNIGTIDDNRVLSLMTLKYTTILKYTY